jgi:hypothetical protein
VRMFSTARDSASIISVVSKWQPFSFIFNRGNRENHGGWGTTVIVVSSKKFPGEKGSVRWYVLVMQQFFVTKVRGEVFAHFHAVARKGHSSFRNWLFGLQGPALCEQYPWFKRKWLACSWLCSLPVSPFSVSVTFDAPFKYPCTAYAFFPERLSNHCQGLRRNLSKICTKFDADSQSDPSRNRLRPDTPLQTKGRKYRHVLPAARNCVHWLPKICQYYHPRDYTTLGNYGYQVIFLG